MKIVILKIEPKEDSPAWPMEIQVRVEAEGEPPAFTIMSIRLPQANYSLEELRAAAQDEVVRLLKRFLSSAG